MESKKSSNESGGRSREPARCPTILIGLVGLLGGALGVAETSAAEAMLASPNGPSASTRPPGRSTIAWPESRPAALAKGWVEAFVAGEPAMRRFLAEGFAESTLATKSIDERVASYRSLRERLGTLRLVRVVEERPDAIVVGLADAEENEHEFSFEIELEQPRKLLTITATLHLGHSLFPH